MRSLDEKRQMVDRENKDLTIKEQCDIIGIHKSGIYYKPASEKEENLKILRFMDEQYLKTPFYGIRKLTALLQQMGYFINKKRVRRLMKIMDWQTIYRKPRTTQRNIAHEKFPYLLKDFKIDKKNQVWGVDITYIPMPKGHMYLFAIIDLKTRFIVDWSVSNTMSGEWVTQVVSQAIKTHGRPEIINSDQGSQFTGHDYINLLQSENIKISMDGKGRAIDNIFIERFWRTVKYECVYLNAFEDGLELYKGLKEYFRFYNTERLHQNLNYKIPVHCYSDKAA